VYWCWPRRVAEYVAAFLVIFPFVWFYLSYRFHVKAEQKAKAKAQAEAEAKAKHEAFEERIETELQALKKALKRAEATNMKVTPVYGWYFSDHEQLSSQSFRQDEIGFVKGSFLYIQKDVVHFLYSRSTDHSLDANGKVYVVHRGELEMSELYALLTIDFLYNGEWPKEKRRKEAFAAHVFQAYTLSQDHKYVKERIKKMYKGYEIAVPPPPYVLTEVPPSGLLTDGLGGILVSVYMGATYYASGLNHTATPGLFVNTDTNKKSREKKPMNWKRFLPWLF